MAFKLCDAGQGPCVQGHHVQRGVRRYRLTVGHRARLLQATMAGDSDRIAEGNAMKFRKITIAIAGSAMAIGMGGGMMAASAAPAAHLVSPSRAATHSAYAGYIGTQTNSKGQA